MKQKKTSNVWITGASSGLGNALAVALARRGDQVVASARNEIALRDLEKSSSNISVLPCDITDSNAMEKVSTELGEINSLYDLVVLNAGSCEYLDFPDPDWSAVNRVMEVNYFGTVNCVKAVLPFMKGTAEKHSHLVVIASQATMAPFPRAEAYGSSKAAIQYFFSSLRMDLLDQYIDVTVINPGFVDTPLTQKNDFPMPFLMDVDTAADRILSKLKSRPREYSFPKRLKMFLGLSRIFPGFWQKMVVSE